MKTADGLFEEIGYKPRANNRYWSAKSNEIYYIDFITNTKKVSFYISSEISYFKKLEININTFKAIQLKLKELGWTE